MLRYIICAVICLIQAVLCDDTLEQQVLSRDQASTRACDQLATLYPDNTITQPDPKYPIYQDFAYWAAQQSDLQPRCRFLAPHTYSVKQALEICYTHNVSFAISSGGHSCNTGFSNVDDGVTIDLSFRRHVEVQDDRASIWIDAGAEWGDVYRDLEYTGLTVAGARASGVGVGGFLLGGGISFFANQAGFGCDAVLAFEIVTPDLQILQVDHEDHPDLFWALKGSAGAFGVVTAVKMRTIKTAADPLVYAGFISFEEEHLPQVLSVLAKTSTDAVHDEFTSSYLSFGYLAASEEFVYTASIMNTQSNNDTLHLKDWRSIPSIHSCLRHTTVLAIAEDIARGGSGLQQQRRHKFTFTTSPQLEKITPIYALFRNFAKSVQFDEDCLLGMEFQPLKTQMLEVAVKNNNPNIFSETLVQDMVPLLVVSVDLWWSDRDRDAEFEGLMRALHDQMLGPEGVGWAKHTWIYPNYAAMWQEPLAEWRLVTKTLKKLKEVKNRYDPEGMWERLRPTVWHF